MSLAEQYRAAILARDYATAQTILAALNARPDDDPEWALWPRLLAELLVTLNARVADQEARLAQQEAQLAALTQAQAKTAAEVEELKAWQARHEAALALPVTPAAVVAAYGDGYLRAVRDVCSVRYN